MSIKEIKNIKEKYPVYRDMSDMELARKLAKKFPKAYSDLPKKVSLSQNMLQRIGGNIVDAAKETYREGVSPMLSGVSSALFGIPKAIIPEKARGVVFPEQETLEGKALRGASESVGFIKGAPMALGKAVAGKIIPFASAADKGIGLGSKIGDIAKYRKIARLAKMGREGIQFGTAGLTTLDEKPTIEGQLGKGLVGFGIGAATGFLPTGKPSLSKKIAGKESFYKKATGQNISLSKDLSTRASQIKEQLNNLYKGKGISLSESNKLETANNLTKFSKDFANKQRSVIGRIQKNVSDGADYIVQSVKNMQEYLKLASKDLSKAYDTAMKNFPKEITIDKSKALKILGKNVDDLERIGFSDASQNIKKLIQQIQEANTDVSVKELVNKYQSINKALSTSSKEIGQFSSSDVGLVKLKSSILDILDKNGVKEFSQLNRQYGKAANNIYQGMKLFKPAKGELGTKTGENFLQSIQRRVSKGQKVPSQDIAILKNLEDGFNVMGIDIKGSPQILSNLQRRGLNIKSLSEELQKLKSSVPEQRRLLSIYNTIKSQKNKQLLSSLKFQKSSKIDYIQSQLSLGKKLKGATIGVAQRAAEAAVIYWAISQGISAMGDFSGGGGETNY